VDRQDYTEIGPGFRERMAEEGPYFERHMEKLVKERDEATKKINIEIIRRD